MYIQKLVYIAIVLSPHAPPDPPPTHTHTHSFPPSFPVVQFLVFFPLGYSAPVFMMSLASCTL